MIRRLLSILIIFLMANNIISTLLKAKSKRIIILRHGRTFMNEHLSKAQNEWGGDGFKDAEIWDTRLTPKGIKQAKILNFRIMNQFNDANNNENEIDFNILNQAELLVSSPLTRAIETAQYTFENTHFFPSTLSTSTTTASNNKVLIHLAAERMYLSSDVGRPRKILEEEYPLWDYSHLTPSEQWWYTNKHYPIDDTHNHLIYPLSKEHSSVDTDAYTEWRSPGSYVIHSA